jgi:hypothetical protein
MAFLVKRCRLSTVQRLCIVTSPHAKGRGFLLSQVGFPVS